MGNKTVKISKYPVLAETAERVAGYVSKWRKRRRGKLDKLYKKIESKGSSLFTRQDKIICSELIFEFGQQATKIISILSIISEDGKKKVLINKKKYPNLLKYFNETKFYPPLTIEYV